MSEPKHTPGPWRWEINLSSKHIALCGGVPRYDLTVMDFTRWGMGGGAPMLREDVDRMNIMHRVERWAKVVPGREHHADWFRSVDHPDMHLIAAAPKMFAALKAIVNSDMAMREEDEGRESPELDAARAAIAQAEGGAK